MGMDLSCAWWGAMCEGDWWKGGEEVITMTPRGTTCVCQGGSPPTLGRSLFCLYHGPRHRSSSSTGSTPAPVAARRGPHLPPLRRSFPPSPPPPGQHRGADGDGRARRRPVGGGRGGHPRHCNHPRRPPNGRTPTLSPATTAVPVAAGPGGGPSTARGIPVDRPLVLVEKGSGLPR
eukprot:TRINITY_DN8959_c0_g1_i1.p3 TRINITY_DN8959_c0_g1~~TRINITY_DN8959_c0_g1_i1.p3  ORF type:complete len:176 (+),score=11.63 TRINITY_DN8959_c0_g1_i1:460-987(+)